MRYKFTFFALFVSLIGFSQNKVAITSKSNIKIPIDGNRWYQLTNATNGLQALTDGDTITSVFTGWGKIIRYYDSYYPVLAGENISIDSIRMYDRGGAITVPTTIYAIDSNWNKTLIATYSGGIYNSWIGPNPQKPTVFKLNTAAKNVKYLLLTSGDDYPTEIEFFGTYHAPNPIPALVKPTVKLNEMLGVNGFEWNFENAAIDPTRIDSSYINPIKAFSGFRHYMDWQKLENTKGSYTYNPTNSGGWNYDTIYAACKLLGITVLADLKNQAPWMQATWPDSLANGQNVPVNYGSDFTVPASYTDQAKLAFQYAARYGSNKNVNKSLLSVNNIPRWTGDPVNTIRTGLNTVHYIECDNERDKWWLGRNAYQTGREYAANLSAFYDGHKKTLGAGVGVKNADTNMQVVMCGIADPSTDYFRAIIDWCKQYRGYKPDGTVNLCFDVINYHYYPTNNQAIATAPELANTDSIASAFINMAHQYAGNMPVWVTESGYDLNQGSANRAIPIGSKTALTTQADWNLRTALLYARAGVQRLFFYELYDNDNSGNSYSTSGLLNNDHSRRPASDYLYQVNHQFGNFSFKESLSVNPVVDKYQHADTVVYVMYVPDQVGRTATYNLNTNNADSVYIYTPVAGANHMQLSRLKTNKGHISITATETPVFVRPVIKKSGTEEPVISTDSIQNKNLKVYPNPGSDYIIIETPSTTACISLINVQGKIIKEIKSSGNQYRMDISSVPSGIYFIKIVDQSGTTCTAFIKANGH
jgi:hypothetical protein